jgi:hypothetical protein
MEQSLSAEAAQPIEQPSAAAFLVASLTKVQAAACVPASQAQTLITIFASLTGLAIMGALVPAITLSEARGVLAPGWIAAFLIVELVIAAAAGIVPYVARR